jgi:hypothetical protein
MILDAILLALTEIASAEQRSLAIFPGMRIPQGDKVQITHPVSGFELWLRGNVDYAIIQYENVRDYKGKSDYHTPSRSELLNGLFRPLARPWWVQK